MMRGQVRPGAVSTAGPLPVGFRAVGAPLRVGAVVEEHQVPLLAAAVVARVGAVRGKLAPTAVREERARSSVALVGPVSFRRASRIRISSVQPAPTKTRIRR